MNISLDGKIALVTGASSGIGRGVALGLVKAGASVILCARRLEKLDELADNIKALGGKSLVVPLDVTVRTRVTAVFNKVEKELGTPDIVINNAGTAQVGNFLALTEKERDQVMKTNFDGVWNIGQEAAQRMVKANKGGSIINIASILGYGAVYGYSAYSASKGAVLQLTRSMALDLSRKGIRVNGIAPGWFNTEMNKDFLESPKGQAYLNNLPAQRSGELDELIGPVIFLASDAASFINGTILPVDGGHHCCLA